MSVNQMPEEFTVADLLANGFTEAEVQALSETSENNPALFAPAAEAQDPTVTTPAAPKIGDAPAAVAQPAPQAEALNKQIIPQAMQIPDTKDAEQVVAKAEETLAALADQYDNGELSRDEWLKEQNRVIAEQTKAKVLIEQATATVTAAQESVEQVFYAAQEAYYTANSAADLLGDEHFSNWDRHLRDVTGNQQLANSLTANQLITLAHKRYADEYQLINGKPLPIAVPSFGEQPKKLQVRQDPREDAAQTLATVNGDLSNAVTDSQIAAFDRIAQTSPMEAEAMLLKMTPAMEEAFLRNIGTGR